MFVVIFGLFVIFLGVVVFVVMAAGATASQRKLEVERLEREDAEIRNAEEELKLLSIPGEPLICLGCQKRFPGPMPEGGCPDCQIASLVVAERSGKNGNKT